MKAGDESLPPHPSPKLPSITLLPGACDAHCHVFGPAAQFPFAPERTYTPCDAPAERLSALHERLGIERAVLVQASCHGSDNTAMLDAMSRSKGRWRGVATLRPEISREELNHLHASGVRAARFMFVTRLGAPTDLKAAEAICEKVAEFGWHAVVNLESFWLERLTAAFRSMPVPVVIDHMGRVDASKGIDQPDFRRLMELLEDGNVWVKVSGLDRITREGPPYADAMPFARMLVKRFPERILWGTDWPHPNTKVNMPDDGALVDRLVEMVDDEADLRRILVDNPDRLYWS